MDLSFYALGRTAPSLTVSDVGFFGVWAAMKAELADHYGVGVESFDLAEASWGGDTEYAELIRLNGRIVGALERALTQDDVAAIWGVDRMEKRAFTNRIRSLYNIDGDLLPELTGPQQREFLQNPVGYFLNADELQSDAIMREIERRQGPAKTSAAEKVASSTASKTPRPKKAKGRIEGQTELLLPIAGGKPAAERASRATAATRRAG